MKLPKGILQKNNKMNKNINYSNRGMDLESDIELSCQYYADIDKAYIYKKPTPIQIVKMDYNVGKKITEAYFKEKSQTDYNGIYKGKYIDFEAKETNVDRFPLNNIKQHQFIHLQNIINHGGIAFIIVRFIKYNKYFLLTLDKIDEIVKTGKKSINLKYFINNIEEIEQKYSPRLDFLSNVDKIWRI